MGISEEDFLQELLAMFKIEAEEHLKTLSSGLLELENAPVSRETSTIIETIYREAHSLKGAARSVNMTDMETLCQSLESVFASLKKQDLTPSPEIFDTLHKAIDCLANLIEKSGGEEFTEALHQLNHLEHVEKKKQAEHLLIKSIKEESKSEKPVDMAISPNGELPNHAPEKVEVKETGISVHQQKETVINKSSLLDTIRVATSSLDSLMFQAEELVAAKLGVSQHGMELRDVVSMFDLWKKDWEKIDKDIHIFKHQLEKNSINTPDRSCLEKFINYLDLNQKWIKSLAGRLTPMSKQADVNSRILSHTIENILDDMKKVLMLPFSTLVKIFPKIVRDLSRTQGKETELQVRGSTIEVSRRILEEMKDPLIHILRNCIDHGIEKPDVRCQQNKQPAGKICVSISQLSDNKIEIEISDDGAGINCRKVKMTALEKGFISKTEAEKLSDKEALSLVFQSDISTSTMITDISGRGLGLAIVREKVEKLGGMINIDTIPGSGTTFNIVIPVTLAAFRGTLVLISDQIFVIQSQSIERIVRVRQDEIKTVENRKTIKFNGQTISFVRLADVLELSGKKTKFDPADRIQVIVVTISGKQVGLGVDEVLDEREVLVKKLGDPLVRVRNIAGATILGTGKVATILNLSDILKSAIKKRVDRTEEVTKEADGQLKKSILVAEDSITSRTLLKNILETAGYEVKTTVDGMDAWKTLGTQHFDLVVSDVEMPRMNGFELVKNIRENGKIPDLPVVLVTGLSSVKEQECGIDAGADAYIIKKNFNQGNLLDTINKLL